MSWILKELSKLIEKYGGDEENELSIWVDDKELEISDLYQIDIEANGGLSKERNIAIEILNKFEEMLERHDIIIPDDERENIENPANLAGGEYWDLEDTITRIIEDNTIPPATASA